METSFTTTITQADVLSLKLRGLKKISPTAKVQEKANERGIGVTTTISCNQFEFML